MRFVRVHLKRVFCDELMACETRVDVGVERRAEFKQCQYFLSMFTFKTTSIPPELRCRMINMTVHERCTWGTRCVLRALMM
jgi:hypothetical protein